MVESFLSVLSFSCASIGWDISDKMDNNRPVLMEINQDFFPVLVWACISRSSPQIKIFSFFICKKIGYKIV
ncbi:MAG: hypothetical protein WCG25_05525 [bacterium]